MSSRLQIITFFIFSLAYAQDPNMAFKTIAIDEGLSQNSVVDIAQDSLGFMWFATQDGLNRFDGKNFKIFPEVFDDITSPESSQLGKLFSKGKKLWMITKGGKLKVMDLCTEDIFPIERLGTNFDPLPPVSAVFEDNNNNLWIGTLENGIYHWNVQTNAINYYVKNVEFPFSLAGNEVRSIFEDRENKIWILTNNGLTRIGGQKTANYLTGISASVLSQDEEGRLWLGTYGDGLFVKEAGEENFKLLEQFGSSSFPRQLTIESINADDAGKIWIGTYGSGLYILNKSTQSVTHLLPERGNPFSLGFQDILSIKKDRTGGVWCGTDGGGVSYYNPNFHSFKRLTAQEVPSNISIEQIRAITTDDDEGIWLGTSGKGLTYFSPKTKKMETFHLQPYKPGINNCDRIVSLLADNEGDLWIGTQGNGLLIKDRKTKNITKWFFSEADKASEVIPDNTIWALLKAGPKMVFAATRNAGILLIHKEKGVIRSFPDILDKENPPQKKNIRSMVKVNDSILAVGSERSAIYLLNTCKNSYFSVSNPLIEETLKGKYGVKSLLYKDGFLWAGTAGEGLLVIHLKSGFTTSLTAADGLPNEMIYGILPEGEHSLWMSSNKGIFKLNYEPEGNKIKVLKIQSFSLEDGLQSYEFNTGAYHKSKKGTLFFGGINGLNYFKPETVCNSGKSGAVVFTDAMLGNRPFESDTTITYKNQIKLPHNQNSISFNYTTLEYLSPETITYEYMLKGYDEEWINAGSRAYSAYTNLPPGDYTFMVKPSDNTVENSKPATLGVSISAPFWLEWWFFILSFLFISGALYLFYKYRINQLLEVQKVKNHISADLHDDIGSRLTSIHFLSAISKQKLSSNEEARLFLEGIDEEVQASAEALNEIVWNIKMNDESLEDIVAKMRRYVGETLGTLGITYAVDIDSDFTGRKMEMQKRREVFLIFKELLNNVRKHANAKRVKISITTRENMFFLSVLDDGQGFDPLKETSRNGIRNIRERITKWKGKSKFASSIEHGSLVEIWLPFDRISWFGKLLRRIIGARIFHPKR